jgi:GMP synthase (glutamine-hydrolysing)
VRVLVFQHQALVGPGYLADAFEGRGARLEVVRADVGEPVPDVATADALMVLGGTMSVYQEAEHPWLAAEDRAIKKAVERGLPVLGVCLGGQMLAKALGAPVHLGGAPEVGVMPIELTPEGRADPLFAGLGDAPEFVSWHDDTFEVPAGAVRLAGTVGCPNHAFRFGEHAYGLQFHPEVSPAMLASWLADLLPDARVDPAAFQQEVESRAEALRARADQLVGNFLAAVRAEPVAAN